MSMKKKSIHFSIPGAIDEFLGELMTEMGLNKSELVTEMVFYVSMPEHLEDFKDQFVLGGAGEDEDEEDEENEDEDENEEEDEEEDEEDEPGFWDRLFGSKDEEEEE